MRVQFPDGLIQYTSKNGRLFFADFHQDRVIDLADYNILDEAEFIDAGFTLLQQAQPDHQEE